MQKCEKFLYGLIREGAWAREYEVAITWLLDTGLVCKSLRVFAEKYGSRDAVRVSMSDFRQQDWMINVPLYNIENLNQYLQERGC